MRKQLKPFGLLVCDLDNTLYDWVAYFVPSFYAMLDKAVELLGCDRQSLIDDFREVHQRHHDTEHPFALLETRTAINYFGGRNRSEMAEALDPAFHAFNSARIRHLRLHPSVEPTLEYIRQRGVKLVAHTESQLFGAMDRLTRLNLMGFFSRVYCRERPQQEHPNPVAGSHWLSRYPLHKVSELSKRQTKPDPSVLAEICRTENVLPTATAYAGDSIARDILMAKKAGVFSIWAKYGAVLRSDHYARLIQITHWTSEDVENERRLREEAASIQPDFVAEHSFAEILAALFPNEGVEMSRMLSSIRRAETKGCSPGTALAPGS